MISRLATRFATCLVALATLALPIALLAKPLPKVRLVFKKEGAKDIEVLTDKEGHFKAEGLPTGKLTLTLKPGRVENLLGDYAYTEAVDVRQAVQGEASRWGLSVALDGKKTKQQKFTPVQVSKGVSMTVDVDKKGVLSGTLSSD
jgi:hypothetical protein